MEVNADDAADIGGTERWKVWDSDVFLAESDKQDEDQHDKMNNSVTGDDPSSKKDETAENEDEEDESEEEGKTRAPGEFNIRPGATLTASVGKKKKKGKKQQEDNSKVKGKWRIPEGRVHIDGNRTNFESRKDEAQKKRFGNFLLSKLDDGEFMKGFGAFCRLLLLYFYCIDITLACYNDSAPHLRDASLSF